MSDHDHDPIERSLKRQFEPPDLGDLEARIAAAADGESLPDPSVARVEPAQHEPAANDSRLWGLAVAVAVAAAVVLVLAWPGGGDAPTTTGPQASRPSPPAAGDAGPADDAEADGGGAPAGDGRIAMAPTSHELAGRQLHDFLHGGGYETAIPDGADCSAQVEPAPPSCQVEPGAPALPPSPDLALLWECGGMSGIDCAAHDLPAQRLLVVRHLPDGPNVIVCIEPPDKDPRPELPGGSDLNIFRRTLGDYVLYEVTPQAEPAVVDRLTI